MDFLGGMVIGFVLAIITGWADWWQQRRADYVAWRLTQ